MDFPDDLFVVICRADRDIGGNPGEYVLTTRRVFNTREDAQRYADGCAPSRDAIVVSGRWHQLRLGEDEEEEEWEPETGYDSDAYLAEKRHYERIADHVDGYDRDDLGESPDF